MGRVMRRDQAGVVDAAVASQVISPPEAGRPYSELLVTIQNRGTSMLVNTGVEVSTPIGQYPLNITTLAAGAIQTFHFPLPADTFANADSIDVQSTVTVTGNSPDAFPANNTRNDKLVPADVP
jgi:hypothetical protein